MRRLCACSAVVQWRSPVGAGKVRRETEAVGLFPVLESLQETLQGQEDRDVKNGYCGRPEWADEEGCPIDNPNEEMKDCDGCRWFKETEDRE